MGRKLDALLGRNFKTSKFKTLAKLAISRIAILKNQHQARYSHARSDTVELLKLGHHERALQRVEYVIKEHNMLDVLVMMENYCHLLRERVLLIQNNKECPDELNQAVSSLIFASSRCGEFPELQKIREIFTSRFGKEFTSRAVELRNSCSVNPKVVRKFSSRQPDLENRLKVLEEIASENGITLHLEESTSAVVEEELKVDDNQKQLNHNESATSDDTRYFPEELNLDEKLSESVRARKKYRDVAAAARDAFQSAAHAAAAARAAVELARSDSQYSDMEDDDDDDDYHQGNVSDPDVSLTPNLQSNKDAVTEGNEDSDNGLGLDEIQPIENLLSQSNDEDKAVNNSDINLQELEETKSKEGQGEGLGISASRSEILEQITGNDSDQDILNVGKQLSNFQSENEQVSIDQVALDAIKNDTGMMNENIPGQKHEDSDTDRKPCSPTNEYRHLRENSEVDDQYPSDDDRDINLLQQSPKVDSLKSQDDSNMERKTRLAITHSLTFVERLHSENSSIDWKPLSMRTRRAQGV
ncbi:hypothetical protein Ddye_001624 [Dipteronia dyeriana]|uniref:IST1-like protein n=1 Tax=Dipteronia dyeriana TaxID=168575 RepID=A0AAD9XPL6_9ROSI|nr:hypothetical protein Ddye_001624 [Dipteronia dyeriana]